MRVHCHTNIDKHSKECWPQSMATRPLKGDYVSSVGGKKLKIVAITHMQGGKHREHEPYLDIELHN